LILVGLGVVATKAEPPPAIGATQSASSDQGAKYPKRSGNEWVGWDGCAAMLPLPVERTAMLELTAPSDAFSVDTASLAPPCGHSVQLNGVGGTTVALKA
jgi:hypothetical protein